MMDAGSANDISPKKTYRTMAGVAVAIFVLIGVAIYSLSRLSTTPWSSDLRPPPLQKAHRQALPQFEHVADGKLFSPANLEGHWTLLSFWSYTCPPCLVELPGLNRLAQSWNGPELEVLTVNSDGPDDVEASRRFVTEQEITLPMLMDKTGALKKAFAVTDYPRHFLIAPNKTIVWNVTGAFQWDTNTTRDQLLKLMDSEDPEADADPDPEKSPDPPE